MPTPETTEETSNLPPELIRYLIRLANKFAGMENHIAIQLVLEYAAPKIAQLYRGNTNVE